jgi:Tol biopolymer transport system component
MALDCGISVLQKSGATPQAIAFVRELNGEGYMSAFHEKGRVDVAEIYYPARANDNAGYALVNGVPSVVRADDWNLLKPIDQTVLQSEIGRQNPQAFLWASHAALEKVEPGPVGGQRFVFSYDLLDCHACPQLAFAFVAFDFDSVGNFLRTSLVSLMKDYQPLSQPTSFADSGSIAYIDSNLNVWVTSPDGTQRLQITQDGHETIDAQRGLIDTVRYCCPVWSPDGAALAFHREEVTPDATPNYVWSAWVWGTNDDKPRQVVENASRGVAWSPDSSALFYVPATVEWDGLQPVRPLPGIWQVEIATGAVSELLPAPLEMLYPLWGVELSPSGRYLSGHQLLYEGLGPLLVIDLETRDYWQIGIGGYSWSPDETSFVYDEWYYAPEPGTPIWISDIHGQGARALTIADAATTEGAPQYSPQGNRIVFIRWIGGLTASSSPALWIMNSDGSNLRQLTTLAVWDVAWSPDGKWLAAWDSNSSKIYLVDTETGQTVFLVEGHDPVWQPGQQSEPIDLTALIADKRQLISSLSNLSVDFLGVQSVKPPSFKSYDESQALALLDELSAQSHVSTLTQTQAGNFERLVLFERALHEFYRLDARAADNTVRSLAGVIGVGWQWIKTLDTLQNILKGAPLGDIINRLLQRAKEKALDIIHSYVQFLVGLVPDPDLHEGLQIAAWEIFEVLKVGVSEGRSVLEVLRDGAVVIVGDELLVAQYVTRTQPPLDQAIINARNEVGPGGTATAAEARLQSLLDEEKKWADHAHDSFELADEVADTASVVGNMADIATVVTSPSGAGPAIAQLVSLFAKSVGATAYITGGGLNAWVWYRIPGAVANAPVAAFDPNAQPSGSTPPAEAKLILAAYRPETAEYLTRQEAQLQQASADYEQWLAQVVQVVQQGDEQSLSELIPKLLAADETVSQQSFVSATPVMMSPNASVEQKAALYTARVAFNTETATLYGLLVSNLVEPANTDAQAQTVQQAQTALSAITAYVSLIGETSGQIANEVLPPQVVVSATNVPEAITPGQPFDLTITLANASPSSASNISVHILGEEGHAINQTIPLGEIVGGGQVTTTVSLQVNQGGAAILRVDALEGDAIADSRLVILDVVETAPDKASVASVASGRNTFWPALTIFAIGLIVFVFGLVNLFKSRRR